MLRNTVGDTLGQRARAFVLGEAKAQSPVWVFVWVFGTAAALSRTAYHFCICQFVVKSYKNSFIALLNMYNIWFCKKIEINLTGTLKDNLMESSCTCYLQRAAETPDHCGP